MLRVELFGGVRASIDGRPVQAPARRRAWSLLAWLALHPGLHARSGVAAAFWPDVLDQSARGSLRSALWSLRRALGPSGDDALVITGDSIGIDPARGAWVDALAFDELVAAGRLEEAVELCRGPLLAGIEEDWAVRAADEHRDRLADVLERLAAAAEAGGDLARAVRLTRRQTALDPFGEEAHRRLMRRHAEAGDLPAALNVYARLVDRLRGELRLAPSAATRALAAELRDPARAASAGGAAPPAAPSTAVVAVDRRAATLRRPALVGRQRDFARLLEAWRAARTGLGAAVCVSGEAGIGKTRVVAELMDRAREDGARVAACAALDLGGVAPFGLWAELLRDLVRDLPLPEDEAWPSEAMRLAPELEGRARRGAHRVAVPPELERARLFEAIVQLAEWAARDRPLLLVLEDLHAADGASIELAGYVARRLAGTPRLMVLTMREHPARPEVDALLAALRARGILADEIGLEPLPPEAIGRLVRGVANLDAEDVVRIIEASEGNPLLAAESARSLARGERTLSAGLRGAVRASTRKLDREGAALAELVAVAGRGLDHRELEALPLADPAEAAAGAIRSGLLVAEDDGRLDYRHALLREAVYLDLPEPRRAQLHEAVAGALAAGREAGAQPPPAEIARHLRLAHRDALAVAQLAQAAADAQAVGALAEAVSFLEEAVELAPTDAALLLGLAEAHAWRGHRAEAETVLGRAIDAIGPADSPALLEAHLRAGAWFRGALCDPRRSLEAYRRALALLDAGAGADVRAGALVGAAWCEAVAGDLDAADGLLAQVEALAGAAGEAVLQEAAAASGHALVRRGRFLEAAETLLEGAEAAILVGRPDRGYDCWINAATSTACAGDFDRALVIADRALASMRESGFATLELEVLAGRAHILARLGRLAEAADAAEAERELAGRLGDPALRARADHDAGLIALAAGDHARAEALLAAALADGAPVGRSRARLARAEALVRLGRLSEAADELDATALEPIRPSDFPDTLVARLTRVEGLLAAAAGDRALAARRLEEAMAIWRRRRGSGLPAGEQYVANLVDLGRAPVLGLIEPDVELRRAAADLEALTAATA